MTLVEMAAAIQAEFPCGHYRMWPDYQLKQLLGQIAKKATGKGAQKPEHGPVTGSNRVAFSRQFNTRNPRAALNPNNPAWHHFTFNPASPNLHNLQSLGPLSTTRLENSKPACLTLNQMIENQTRRLRRRSQHLS
jgi:hypothetical protein